MVICLQRGVNDLHTVKLMPLSPHHLCFRKARMVYCSGISLPGLSRPLNDGVCVTRTVNGRVADDLAQEKDAVQISTDVGPASAAVDGDLTTTSCTTEVANPWWSLDLEQKYLLSHVSITSPDMQGYRNYRASFVNL